MVQVEGGREGGDNEWGAGEENDDFYHGNWVCAVFFLCVSFSFHYGTWHVSLGVSLILILDPYMMYEIQSIDLYSDCSTNADRQCPVELKDAKMRQRVETRICTCAADSSWVCTHELCYLSRPGVSSSGHFVTRNFQCVFSGFGENYAEKKVV